MRYNRREFAVQMRGKPVGRSQLMQQLLGRAAAQPIVGDLVAKVWFEATQLFGVAKVVDTAWPVVRQANVQRAAELLKPEHVQLAYVVYGLLGVLVVRCYLVVAAMVVVSLEDAWRQRANRNNFIVLRS